MTLEDAVQWCVEHEAEINFVHGCVFVYVSCSVDIISISKSDTFVCAVEKAKEALK